MRLYVYIYTYIYIFIYLLRVSLTIILVFRQYEKYKYEKSALSFVCTLSRAVPSIDVLGNDFSQAGTAGTAHHNAAQHNAA